MVQCSLMGAAQVLELVDQCACLVEGTDALHTAVVADKERCAVDAPDTGNHQASA